jgi:hypothetical protein
MRQITMVEAAWLPGQFPSQHAQVCNSLVKCYRIGSSILQRRLETRGRVIVERFYYALQFKNGSDNCTKLRAGGQRPVWSF